MNDAGLHVVWQGTDRSLCRVGARHAFVPGPAAGEPSPDGLRRLEREADLKDLLDPAWSLRPLELLHEGARTLLLVDYAGGEPLDRQLGQPMETARFLRIALAMSASLGRLHGRGIIHKDLKPANVVVDAQGTRAWLTGFGIATRLPRERQAPEPPEFIAGTLAYMAPEQTGRVNRSIDSRSDLYALGVSYYEMLTGSLPFSAGDAMEWVHCHIARTPVPPHQRVAGVPAALSAITMKLLAKTVEERYQTATGVENDLRRCLELWNTQGRIDDFTPGQHDTPDRLLIPEKLYGRDREIGTLLATFDRVVAGGRPEMVLVSGYSGIGKSAVVNELHKPLVPPRGLFAAGKFDQYKRDIPYATLAQAFQSLIRPLLGRSEAELRHWRDALREALDPNGQLIVELVPELRHVIGEQPPVPQLPPSEAQGRFQLVLRRFIEVFARADHPLALFLDDLQWLDTATLDLLEDLLLRSDLQHLLLIGAYRDNEVHATHPLVRKLEAMRAGGAKLHDIVLAPLTRDDLAALLHDSLHCAPGRAAPLARMIHDKTSGNPFFAIQFLSTLADEGLLAFDYGQRAWTWDLDRIHAKGYTDNVVELMVGKLERLPPRTQEALQQFACMGNSAGLEMLAMVYQGPIEELHDSLWEAVRAGLILRSDQAYRFLHDRVQEAAYSQIPPAQRAGAHLRIGTLMAEHTPPAQREEAIFEIVNQLNRGAHLLASSAERERVAELDLLAGRRAKSSTAYESALKYLRAGRALLDDETWQRHYELMFAIEYAMSECELLSAQMPEAERRMTHLAERARNRHDQCVVTRLRLTLYTALDRADRAADVFLDWLRQRDGTAWSKHPSRDDVMREYQRIWALLGDRQIEELFQMPLVTDPDVLDTLDVFTEIVTPALLYDEQLSSLVVCRMVNISLEHGNCDGSCFCYVWLGMFAGPRFDNYRDGFRFAQLGYDLVEKRALTRYQARTYMNVGCTVIPWARHVGSGRELIRRAFDAAYRIGDLTFAAYSMDQMVTNFLAVGDPLALTQVEAENGMAFAQRVGFGLVVELVGAMLGLTMSLRGLTPSFGKLDHLDYTELDTERRLAANPNLVYAELYYLIRKCEARFYAGDAKTAAQCSLKADRLTWLAPAQFETAEHQLYGALAHAMAWDEASPDDRAMHLAALRGHHRQLSTWAEHSPETFENRAAIAAAEIARIEGRLLDAEGLYEQAIRSAREHGFVHHEAFCNELASRFHAQRGFATIADAYLREARRAYVRWGASAKVRQIDERHPHLGIEPVVANATATMQAPMEELDLATVIKVSNAVSGEIVLARLIDTLMHVALEHAGAQRGLLVLPRAQGHWIEAQATTGADRVEVALCGVPVSGALLPESVLRYVLRTKESVVLQDAGAQSPFADDPYLREQRARSVLCLPILKQGRVLGVLYLENQLTPHAFTPARLSVLKLLASEAASSMENARLYRDLAEREARIRRLVDANIIGIILWDLQGRILEANDAFLRMVGYDRDDLVSSGVRWTDLTPPEWRDRDRQQLVPELVTTGSLQPFEKEFFRKDGSRVPVLMGVATFEDDGQQGVAFVLDLSERKRATEALRTLQAELTHANRLATMGQLAASIAHEVNQPIGASRNNAHAALRFLSASPPDLAEVKEALESVVAETYLASDIIGRIRGQIRKLPPRMEAVDVNEAIEDVVALVRGELLRHGVTHQLQLAAPLPPAHADRVQLQQVMLNLILNAIEAMAAPAANGEPCTLVIRTEAAGAEGLQVSIADSGTGVPAEYRARIFESFFTTKPEGVGIGLAICRAIVEAHGGRLWVEAHPPRGAVFRFTLPLQH